MSPRDMIQISLKDKLQLSKQKKEQVQQHKDHPDLQQEQLQLSGQQELLLIQKLDHFSSDPRTFEQRYFLLDQFAKDNSKLIVYICGEGPCKGITADRQLPALLARELGATVLTLEHRFYGQSVPIIDGAQDLSTAHLKYLSIQQALADLAYLINMCQSKGLHNFNQDTKVVTMGGSYPGALSAWFRQQYPQLTVGALASSAVVEPIIDFHLFDRQTGLSLQKVSQACYEDYKAFFMQVQSYTFDQLKHKVQTSLGSGFTVDSLEDTQWLVTDLVAMGVQYGHKHYLCSQSGDIWGAVAGVAQLLNIQDAKDYDQSALRQISYDLDHPTSSRQWMWQSCTQVGWFQTQSQMFMRPSTQNMSFYQQMCQKVFGIPIQTEAIDHIRSSLKGKSNDGTNIIFTNGADDQWQWASITKSNALQKHVLYIDCKKMDCGHCQDLHTPSANDEYVLIQARNTILQLFTQWLN